MSLNYITLFPVLLLLLPGSAAAAALFPFPPPPASPVNVTLEYIDPTLPPLLPGHDPKCSLTVLQHDFANTAGEPPISAAYAPPPDCPAPWSRVVIELSGRASDIQKDRIAAIWVDGSEILRTSTPFPMAPGVFWRVRKDVTRYTALLRGPPVVAAAADAGGETTFSMMLENSNASLPGVYSVNVSLHFYRGAVAGEKLTAHPTVKGLYRQPADLILPISSDAGDCCPGGYWFKVHNDSDEKLTALAIPNNTYRAVLELYASHHGEDEYWYSNPLRSTTASSSSKANGGFRQVSVSIDKLFAGAVVPFPVIYPGSINPFFWAPVSAIGVYDLPSYDLDLTPFVGLLLDGREHEFRLTVTDSRPFWLVSGNLHLWLDAWSDGVEGALVRHRAPPLRLNRQTDWRGSDGKSSVDGQVIVRFAGWVSSSKGNMTTSVRQRLKFKSKVEVRGRGTVKLAAMEVNSRTDVGTKLNRAVVGRVKVSREAPLVMVTESSNGGGGSELRKTKMSHGLTESSSVVAEGEAEFSAVADLQEAEGTELVADKGAALWGSGDTRSTYSFRDDKACYLRTVNVVGGRVRDDVETATCAAAA
ncbi:Peptide-N4-(N-acetyl-beta-glucosaminyl)asparagine amidase A [Apostasia shenzhenica]|uniref:Peptide-N4-(N-acetyl-beta-glucosaminyl)asparagine amidase A n=1 Tax=Apostasia shenzhenica TaxID=1088818 RepID=A0A2I0AIC8_9ASPA|nr:Peptide-N4-(N-acetyl-beta-glucosaminyl)asparagine amidase A [Apostasia shenzhenica]